MVIYIVELVLRFLRTMVIYIVELVLRFLRTMVIYIVELVLRFISKKVRKISKTIYARKKFQKIPIFPEN